MATASVLRRNPLVLTVTGCEVGTAPLLGTVGILCRFCSQQGQGPVIKSKARAARFRRNEILRHNRRNPQLEREARRGTCISLETEYVGGLSIVSKISSFQLNTSYKSPSVCLCPCSYYLQQVFTLCISYLASFPVSPPLVCRGETGNEAISYPQYKVHSEWQQYEGKKQLQTIGLHFNIYSGIFGQLFKPRGLMGVVYGDSCTVHRGNIISAADAANQPTVTGLPGDRLCTLVLSNPDGHLIRSSKELLHWMVVNIRGGGITTGEEVCPYLPPIPPRGTGLHRLVFALYTHPTPVNSAGLTLDPEEPWLEQRTFSTQSFLSAHPTLEPFAFSFYQSHWDETVHTTYMDTLAYPEPVYDLEREPNQHKLQQEAFKQKRANRYRNM